MFFADLADFFGVSVLTVKMNDQDSFGIGCYRFLDTIGVDLIGVDVGFNENRDKVVLRDCEYRSDVSIGRYDYSVAGCQPTELDVSPEYEI